MPVLQKKNSKPKSETKVKTVMQSVELELAPSVPKDPSLYIEINGRSYDIEACEAHFQEHPKVLDCLLIKVGVMKKQLPALVFTTDAKIKDRTALSLDMLSWARKNQQTSGISLFYLLKSFPAYSGKDRAILRRLLEKSVNPTDYLECPVS